MMFDIFRAISAPVVDNCAGAGRSRQRWASGEYWKPVGRDMTSKTLLQGAVQRKYELRAARCAEREVKTTYERKGERSE